MSVQIPQFNRSWPGGDPTIAWWAHMQPVSWARAGRNGRRSFTVHRNEDFRVELQTRWLAAGFHYGRALEGPLAVAMEFSGRSIDARGERHNRPDLSNLVKEVEDAGNGWLWVDDRQIRMEAACLRRWDRDAQPSIAIWVWTLDEWPTTSEAAVLEASA